MNNKYIKNCPECGETRYYKQKGDFNKTSKNKTLCDHCAALKREKKKRELLTEKDIRQRQEKRKIYLQKYYQNNKKRHKENNKKWVKNNPHKSKQYQKKYSQTVNYKTKRNKKLAILRQNYSFRVKENMSRNMRKSLMSQNLRKNGRHWEDLVGYTAQQLKDHIEKQFSSGMSWDNYGDWHLDHIIPKSFFRYKSTDDIEFRYCWSLNNLQPLWAKDNMKKGDSILL